MANNPLEFCTYVDNKGSIKFLTDFISQVIAVYEMELRRNLDGNFPGSVYNAMETALTKHILTPVLASLPSTPQPDDCAKAFNQWWAKQGEEFVHPDYASDIWQAAWNARPTEREYVGLAGDRNALIQKMSEALDFYASAHHYLEVKMDDETDIMRDAGQKAREVLNEVEVVWRN